MNVGLNQPSWRLVPLTAKPSTGPCIQFQPRWIPTGRARLRGLLLALH
jgi:hypothetical protein